jgi:hypothetical protein
MTRWDLPIFPPVPRKLALASELSPAGDKPEPMSSELERKR